MSSRIYYSEEAERIAKRQQMINILMFMLIGMGLGAVIAVLFAPDEGEKTRKIITDAVEDGFRRGVEATSDAVKDLEPEFPDLRLPDLRSRMEAVLRTIRR